MPFLYIGKIPSIFMYCVLPASMIMYNLSFIKIKYKYDNDICVSVYLSGDDIKLIWLFLIYYLFVYLLNYVYVEIDIWLY